ncbi:long-chain acyl-CoA synthetase [Sphingobacterium allocomposti]|jgi:long-chain acyl-CoA synthetase|uniref:Long-chain acyl-CoA synthetase n=1 Tax=Sphingobacterium allocomposti TaxID=415956 RepID=A0A5S5D0C7_9SPHI|nr:long-chain fatty acid--CoA ligase [Sphingobacterium composti Yoo et al. 2007 non Ten et al. 2007]TYP88718.1 long-chain acyl-CoA synthetase [Sphingobacterium composti Yoo et al. 2007 non Ten et al. 2007]
MSKLNRLSDILERYKSDFAKADMVAGKKGGNWKKYATAEFGQLVDNLSKALIHRGLKKGDKVALMSGNRPEWNIVDFACNQIGIAIVPLYPTLSAQDLSYIVNDAEAKLVFVSNAELTKKIDQAIDEHQLSIDVFTFDAVSGKSSYKELVDIGQREDIDLHSYKDNVQPDDLLTLIYTSGTTGKPKGVFLTHKNILSNVEACGHLVPANAHKALSFLPLCHIFERMVVYLYLSKGISIYYAENLDNIVVDINDVKPQIFTTVPRVLEKVYDKVVEKGKALSGIKRSLFFWALELGHQYQEPPKNGPLYNIKLAIARKLIFSKWREALGGNIELIISGGAALQERLARVFWAAGIKVLEGYGLTETSPVIAVNSHVETDVKFGTVGRVLKNLEVKIAQDGEILVKGPSITVGYYKNEQATAEAIDQEGYFHTGDIGEITPDGFLKITDRKKEMFKTAGGKYIAPQTLENKLMESTLIAQTMVVGENQRFPAALIVPAFEELEKWCKHKGITFASKEEVIKKPEVIEKYQKEIDRLNADFGQWEKIKKFALLAKEWTIDGGELTPKLSLKRKVILKNVEDIVNNIYQE